jgi:hypothetical protein
MFWPQAAACETSAVRVQSGTGCAVPLCFAPANGDRSKEELLPEELLPELMQNLRKTGSSPGLGRQALVAQLKQGSVAPRGDIPLSLECLTHISHSTRNNKPQT